MAQFIPRPGENPASKLKEKREFSRHDIEQRAYGLWQADGGKRSETDYWHQALKELHRERENGSAHPWQG